MTKTRRNWELKACHKFGLNHLLAILNFLQTYHIMSSVSVVNRFQKNCDPQLILTKCKMALGQTSVTVLRERINAKLDRARALVSVLPSVQSCTRRSSSWWECEGREVDHWDQTRQSQNNCRDPHRSWQMIWPLDHWWSPITWTHIAINQSIRTDTSTRVINLKLQVDFS